MTMAIRPILSALLRNRAGATLVALQIAITLAIIVNAVYLTTQRVTKIGRPSGVDDQNIFAFWVTTYEKDYDFQGMLREDMTMIRQMPEVIDAAPMNQVPLSGSGNSNGYYSLPDKKGENSPANTYATDDHGARALGVTLSEGRDFAPNDVIYMKEPQRQPFFPASAIISSGFAKALFKDQPALGKDFYDDQSHPIRVIGVISHMQGSWLGWDKVDRTMLYTQVAPPSVQYVVRVIPGSIDRVMSAVEVAMRKRDPNRVIETPMRKMSDMKRRSYAGDSLMAVTLTTVTGLVLVFSSLGIFGLATFSVNSRTRQIGTRRAVGARKLDIVRYFLAENWLITSAGVVVGCCLALGAGYWLSTQYQLPRLDLYYLVGGVLGLWALGQLAAWQPALRAAKVSPAMATRNI
jgi:putative ABC transport system permease protein